MKVFLYARKSTESKEKQVLSIESQIRECEEMARRWGLEVVEVFTEEQSAMDPGRPIFNKMIQKIYAREVDGLLSWKLDRLSRNFIDTNTIDAALKLGVISKVYTMERVIENNTNDKFLLGLDLILSKRMVEDMVVNVKRGMKTKFEKGEVVSVKPFGYQWVNGKLIVNQEKAYWVKKVFELYATGQFSYKTLTKELKKLGMTSTRGKPPMMSLIERTLKNEFYIGIQTFGAMKGPHNCEQIISPALFQKVQEIISGKKSPSSSRTRKHFFPYRGGITCGVCGHAYTAEIQKGHTYYRCTKKGLTGCTSRYIREEALEEALFPLLKKHSAPPSWLALGLAYVRKNHEAQAKHIKTATETALRELASCEAEKMKLFEMRMENLDEMEMEVYEKKKALLKVRTDAAKQKLSQLQNGTDDYYQIGEEVLTLLKDLSSITTVSNKELKGVFFKLIGSNLKILGDGTLILTLKKPFSSMEEVTKKAKNEQWGE